MKQSTDTEKAPIGNSIESKHGFYVLKMKELDEENNILIDRKKRIELELGKVNKELNKGRQLREKYRRLVSRMKQILKAKNRFENSGQI